MYSIESAEIEMLDRYNEMVAAKHCSFNSRNLHVKLRDLPIETRQVFKLFWDKFAMLEDYYLVTKRVFDEAKWMPKYYDDVKDAIMVSIDERDERFDIAVILDFRYFWGLWEADLKPLLVDFEIGDKLYRLPNWETFHKIQKSVDGERQLVMVGTSFAQWIPNGYGVDYDEKAFVGKCLEGPIVKRAEVTETRRLVPNSPPLVPQKTAMLMGAQAAARENDSTSLELFVQRAIDQVSSTLMDAQQQAKPKCQLELAMERSAKETLRVLQDIKDGSPSPVFERGEQYKKQEYTNAKERARRLIIEEAAKERGLTIPIFGGQVMLAHLAKEIGLDQYIESCSARAHSGFRMKSVFKNVQ